MAIDMCVYAGYQSLSAGFLISGRPVDLSGKEEVADLFCFQIMVELRRLEEILFDSISRTIDLYVPDSRDLL